VPRLIREVITAVAPKPVVIAGSIDRAERISALVQGGAAGFTIGTAAFEGAFEPKKSRLADQIGTIRNLLHQACQSVSERGCG